MIICVTLGFVDNQIAIEKDLRGDLSVTAT